MKLKRLEIVGFKSFSEKSRIEFPPGISAIVGPNGCGKSNIVDALRWVMGEQGVKQLRGKTMEDVIFAGTKGKPPLNMAEVSLTLINDNGSAPEEFNDYAEIMMTRRLYRSGESAYLINMQPCRLKDIHNIFMGSGMGTKSYSVIGQGRISTITDAGQDERRLFIEEAAGITRYKNRKTEALRKVGLTNQNLLRVTDIIIEINRQMSSLKRQAKKARQYNSYRERIKNLDIFLAVKYYDELTDDIEETDALLSDLENKDIEHTSKLKKIDAAIEEIKFYREKKDQEISRQKTEKYNTQRNIDKAENDLAYLRKDVERLSEEITGLESVRTDFEEKNRKMESEIAHEEDRNIDLNENITKVKHLLVQEKDASQNIKNRLSQLKHKLDIEKTDFMDLVAEEARYNNIYQNATGNKESLKRRLKRKNEEEKTAKVEVSLAEKYKLKAEKQFELYKDESDELKKQVKIVTGQLEEKKSELSGQVKLVQTLGLERNKAGSRYSALKKMEDNYQWYKDGVRAIMKAYSSKPEDHDCRLQSDNVIGLMADVIEPEPSFETAVEAVLGESLQYILVSDQQAGFDCIDYLQTHGAGRGGFVPVASVKNMEYGRQKKPDPLKKLLNHITVKPGFENIAEALLGHVVVFADIEEALEMTNKNGAFQTIVTKKGDTISHQGIITGGSKDNLSGILAKKKELKELTNYIAGLDHKLEVERSKQKQLESGAVDIESKMQKLVKQKNMSEQNKIEAEKALYKAGEDLKHSLRHLEILQLEMEQIVGEKSEIDDEILRYNQAREEIKSKVRASQEEIARAQEKISSVALKNKEYDQGIIDLNLKLTSLNAGMESSNNTLKRIKSFQDDGIKRFKQIAVEITQKKEKRAVSKNKIVEYEQDLVRMYDDFKLFEHALEKSKSEYYSMNSRLQDNDKIISGIQNKREETLETIRLLEIKRSQKDIKRENITNRMQDTYHRSIDGCRTEINKKSNIREVSSGKISVEQVSVEQVSGEQLSVDEAELALSGLKKKIAAIENVNLGAIKEYEQFKTRHDFLCAQRDDLEKAIEDLHKVIRKINRITQELFMKTFNAVNEKINEVFTRLFEGGSAKLVLAQPDKPLETGVGFLIHPPGKKLTRMSLLSGGEKALSAIALIFSIFLIKPASFCLMDEIDAPLDDVNVFRFNNLLQIIGEKSQILMITHNKKSMEIADTLFGITMEKKGISKIVSVNFRQEKG